MGNPPTQPPPAALQVWGASLLSCCLCDTGSWHERSQGLLSLRQGCLFWSRCSHTFPSRTPRKALRSPDLSASALPLASPRDPGHKPQYSPGPPDRPGPRTHIDQGDVVQGVQPPVRTPASASFLWGRGLLGAC